MSKMPKPQRIWVAVDAGNWMVPWTAAPTRKDCKHYTAEWMGPMFEPDDFRFIRATLAPEKKKS